MYDGRAIANFILDYAEENNIEITNLSLQKISYFCHVWILILTGRPLVKHQFEAWEYGPVLPYLYRTFSEFGDHKISNRATKIDPLSGKSVVVSVEFDTEIKMLMEKMVSFYSALTPSQLVEQSHITGGPWYKVWHHSEKVNPGMRISNESILDFYTSKQCPYVLR